MTDPEFWRRLAKKFKRLDPDAAIRLNWSYFPSTGLHYCAILGDDSSGMIQSEFNMLAARAGQRIDPSDPINGWLIKVKQVNPNDAPGSSVIVEVSTGNEERCLKGAVNRVCEASAALCFMFAARAIEMDARLMANSSEPMDSKPNQPAKRSKRVVGPDAPVTTPKTRTATSIHIEDLLRMCEITQEQLARKMGIEPSQVSRHISGASQPRWKMLQEYDQCFSKLLKKNIVVNRNAPKRN